MTISCKCTIGYEEFVKCATCGHWYRVIGNDFVGKEYELLSDEFNQKLNDAMGLRT